MRHRRPRRSLLILRKTSSRSMTVKTSRSSEEHRRRKAAFLHLSRAGEIGVLPVRPRQTDRGENFFQGFEGFIRQVPRSVTAVIRTHHEEAVGIQNGCGDADEHLQILMNTERRSLVPRETRRIEDDSPEAVPFADAPGEIFERRTAEEFSGFRLDSVERIIFTALVEDLAADVHVHGTFRAAFARMDTEAARIAEKIQNLPALRTLFDVFADSAHIQEKPGIHRIEQIHVKKAVAFPDRSGSVRGISDFHFHERRFEGMSVRIQAALAHEELRTERLPDGGDQFFPAREKIRAEELQLIMRAVAVERHARKTVRGAVHNAIGRVLFRHGGTERLRFLEQFQKINFRIFHINSLVRNHFLAEEPGLSSCTWATNSPTSLNSR